MPDALISMSQTLAAHQHGTPLGIPVVLIVASVCDCGHLLGSTQTERDAAVDEILRRTRNAGTHV